MHGIPRHENEHAACNYYCLGDGLHADIIYLAPHILDDAGDDLLGWLQEAWHRMRFNRTSRLLAIAPATEAATAEEYYPLSYKARPESTLPYRVIYRVAVEGENA